MFDASTVSEALERQPDRGGVLPARGRRAGLLGRRQAREARGAHPVVFPGRGSHANYFEQAVWLGHSAQEGFGCDNTTAPSRKVQTHAVLFPDQPPASATAPFAWLAFGGHWGQKECGPNTGPTGPNTKQQWTEPVSWVDDTWRDSSTKVPSGSTLGRQRDQLLLRRGGDWVGALPRIPAHAVVRARASPQSPCSASGSAGGRAWSPHEPFPIDRARSAGQIYRAAFKLYRRYRLLFVGIGLIFVPLSVDRRAAAAGADPHHRRRHIPRRDADRPDRQRHLRAALRAALRDLRGIAVTAAVAYALGRIHAGDHPDALDAFRGIVPRLGSLGWAWFRVILVAGLLAVTIVGIPLAVVYLVRKAVLSQACVLEDLHATPALRRSSELVSGHGLRVLAISALVNVTASLLGPIVGVAVLFLTSGSLSLINLISSLVYAFVVPYAAIAMTLLFYDLRRRQAGEQPAALHTSPRAGR